MMTFRNVFTILTALVFLQMASLMAFAGGDSSEEYVGKKLNPVPEKEVKKDVGKPLQLYKRSIAPLPHVHKAHHGFCAKWNGICRERWGAGWRYRRCMHIRGCVYDRPHCRRWNAICRERWGAGWRYQRCMRIRAC